MSTAETKIPGWRLFVERGISVVIPVWPGRQGLTDDEPGPEQRAPAQGGIQLRIGGFWGTNIGDDLVEGGVVQGREGVLLRGGKMRQRTQPNGLESFPGYCCCTCMRPCVALQAARYASTPRDPAGQRTVSRHAEDSLRRLDSGAYSRGLLRRHRLCLSPCKAVYRPPVNRC